MRLVVTAAALFLAAASVPEAVRGFLDRHEQLVLGQGKGASCPTAPSPAIPDGGLVERDLTGDQVADVVFLVTTRHEPRRFGVAALHRVAEGPDQEHWVVPLGSAPLAGLSVFHSPYGDWILVQGCSPKDGGSFMWTEEGYNRGSVM